MLIDRDLKAWILEVNDHPSLNIYFDSSVTMEHQVMTDADICPVDFRVKSMLVQDTILLAKKSREAVCSLVNFNSLSKIHPAQGESESQIDLYAVVRNLRQIFYSITPIKNKSQVSAQMFEKLFLKPVVKNCGLQKIDMSLTFQQATGGVAGIRYLNFLGFCHLMLRFYESKLVR